MTFAVEISGYFDGESSDDVEEMLEKKAKELGISEADISVMEVPAEEDEEEDEE